ncbi:unnamed protein product [Orchesella dallaii]|uniref:Rho-GAP domain-containing protein n=1 Tax=Orchesella dallaii TaxID=48710 RepID=A0ABP1RAC6_9HEXA
MTVWRSQSGGDSTLSACSSIALPSVGGGGGGDEINLESSQSSSGSSGGAGATSDSLSQQQVLVDQSVKNENDGSSWENLVGENLPIVMDNRNIGGGRMMTSWAQRMHRRAATLGTVVTSCGHPSAPYPRRIEKVKFGVPLDEVCKNDIPGPLLVLILKLNKEAPYKKDVFRAPGHQGNMKKLIHFLQNGRLVNIDNFSVYTIASVLKKFLRKLPDGIFGRDGEQQLFQIIEMQSTEQQRDHIHS